MHKSLYKISKKINKCDVKIKSIITKRTISLKYKKKVVEKKKKTTKRETKLEKKSEY